VLSSAQGKALRTAWLSIDLTTPDGKTGHLSAQVGDEPNMQLIIQRNDDAWRGVKPGFFS
jgi:hypothetical protein